GRRRCAIMRGRGEKRGVGGSAYLGHRPRGPRPVAGRAEGRRCGSRAGCAPGGVHAPGAGPGQSPRTGRLDPQPALTAGAGGSGDTSGPRTATGGGGRMTRSTRERAVVDDQLLGRVRERLAGTTEPPGPAAVAEAVRSEARGVIGDADMLRALRELE